MDFEQQMLQIEHQLQESLGDVAVENDNNNHDEGGGLSTARSAAIRLLMVDMENQGIIDLDDDGDDDGEAEEQEEDDDDDDEEAIIDAPVAAAAGGDGVRRIPPGQLPRLVGDSENTRAIARWVESINERNSMNDITDGHHGNNVETQLEQQQEPPIISSMKCTYTELAKTIRLIDFGRQDQQQQQQSRHQPQLKLSPELMRQVIKFLIVEPVYHEEVTPVKVSSHDRQHSLSSCLSPDENSWYMSSPNTMPNGVGNEYIQFDLCPTDSTNEGIAGPSCRRLSAVSLKIPPLPLGPLSVLEFELLMPQDPQPRQQDNIIMDDDDGDDDDDSTACPSCSSISIGSDEYVNQSQMTEEEIRHMNRRIKRRQNKIQWKRIGGNTFTMSNRTGWQRFELAECVEIKLLRLGMLRNQMSPYIERDSPSRIFGGNYESVGFYSIKFE